MINPIIVAVWITFVAELCLAVPTISRSARDLPEIPLADFDNISGAYRASNSRSFFFDFDDTLCSSGSTDRDKELRELSEVLVHLASDPKNKVHIISLRPVASLINKFEHKDFENLRNMIYFGGENGLRIFHQIGGNIREPSFSPLKPENIIPTLEAAFSASQLNFALTKPLKGEYGFTFVTQEKQVSESQWKALEEKINEALAGNSALSYLAVQRSGTNKQIWSVLPKTAVKGEAVEWMMQRIEPTFALSMGDSEADEPMHQVMWNYKQHSIVVGEGVKHPSEAAYRLRTPEEARKLIRKLTR